MTFAGAITGSGAVNQIGAGTTILTADNSYGGGTTISAGTLQLGNDGASGSITGNVVNNGTLALNRFDVVTFAGGITGSGAVNQIGTGTTILTADNSYGGGTTISAGTLQLGNGGTSGSIIGNVVNDGTLAFNRSDVVTFAGGITGSGAVNQIGAGTTILTADNSYGGGTTISAGTLQLGNGGTSGSIIGNVVNDGTLAFNRSDVVTFAGGITGSGAVNQIGTGTTILTADNSYDGGTTISAGTLQLGNGGTTGSILGDIANNGTLVFNRSDIVALGATISGTGAVSHDGTGATILTGISTYTGPTNVNAGALIVDGSIAASSGLTVATGALVGGTGALPSTTINGTLSPGNSIGTITINGNLVLGAGAIYRVEVSPTAADLTNVSGSATLAGTAQLVFGPGTYTSNTYTILSAAGGRSGTFDTVTTEGLPPTLSASLSYTATDVLLVTLTSQIAPTLTGTTFNQRQVAAAQDRAFNSGLPSITALFDLPLGQLPAALDQLSGEVHASTAGVLADESRYMRGAVLGRLRQASYGGKTGMASLSLGGPRAFADGEELAALAYGKSPVVKAPMVAPAPASDIVFWAQGFGAWGRFDGDGNAASLRRDLAGFFTGLDTRVGASGRAGIAAGYTGSRNNLDGRGSANVETGHVAGYGGGSFGALNLRAGGAYAFHAIDTDRTIAFPGFFDRATARYDARTGQIFGELGYGFAFGNVAVEPFAGGAWVRLDTDAAAERATTAGLNVAANSFEVGYSTLGIRAASLIPIGDGMVLIPRATAAWQHAFGGVTPSAALAFQLAPAVPFVIAGVPIARDALLAEAGLDLAIGRNATLGVSYVGQIASNVQDHAAKGKFIWRF